MGSRLVEPKAAGGSQRLLINVSISTWREILSGIIENPFAGQHFYNDRVYAFKNWIKDWIGKRIVKTLEEQIMFQSHLNSLNHWTHTNKMKFIRDRSPARRYKTKKTESTNI